MLVMPSFLEKEYADGAGHVTLIDNALYAITRHHKRIIKALIFKYSLISMAAYRDILY